MFIRLDQTTMNDKVQEFCWVVGCVLENIWRVKGCCIALCYHISFYTSFIVKCYFLLIAEIVELIEEPIQKQCVDKAVDWSSQLIDNAVLARVEIVQ